MKLTKDVLKNLISEVRRENSMILSEAQVKMDYSDLMSALGSTDRNTGPFHIGIMTSQNPRAQQSDSQKNLALLRQFMMDMDEEGYDYILIEGQFGGPEDSLFIMNNDSSRNLKHDLIHYGKKYNQQAVVYGEKMIRGFRQEQPSVYYRFSMFETEPENPQASKFHPQEFYESDVRDMVVSGPEAQEKKDYFSMLDGNKFFIPFFMDAHQAGPEPTPRSLRPTARRGKDEEL